MPGHSSIQGLSNQRHCVAVTLRRVEERDNRRSFLEENNMIISGLVLAAALGAGSIAYFRWRDGI